MAEEKRELDTVNPYDPPERQDLERQLDNHTHLQHQNHKTLEEERNLADAAHQAGIEHAPHTDARVKDLESNERILASKTAEDQQNIDHWDRAHPGWDQAGTDQSDSADDGSGGGCAGCGGCYGGYGDGCGGDSSDSYGYAGSDGCSGGCGGCYGDYGSSGCGGCGGYDAGGCGGSDSYGSFGCGGDDGSDDGGE